MTGSLHQALQKAQEIELRVKGRRSGRQIPRPVWFVLDGPAMLLLPLNGPSTQWYRNILEEPRVMMRLGKSTFDTRLTPVTEEKRVRQVIRLFTAKYGTEAMHRYYTNLTVAAEAVVPEGNA